MHQTAAATTETPADVANGAEIVITMLPNGSVVSQAILGDIGVIKTMPSDSLLIDMSTIDPMETDDIRNDFMVRGIAMVDAPVGRTSVHARTGNSMFMVGAEKQHLETARPILGCMCDTIFDCGGPGTGTRMKIVNNLMSTALNVLTAQILTFSDATGLYRELSIRMMGGTAAGQGHMNTNYRDKVLQGDLTPAFMIDIALKFTKQLKAALSLAEEAETIYADAQKARRGGQDWTAIYDMLH